MGFAGGDIGGDGGAEEGAGDFELGDFLIEMVNGEFLLEARHALIEEIDDDKAELVIDGDDATVQGLDGAGDLGVGILEGVCLDGDGDGGVPGWGWFGGRLAGREGN